MSTRDDTYYCAACDQRVAPATEASPCEGHAEPVGPCCSPCRHCRDEQQYAADREEQGLAGFAEGWRAGLMGGAA